MDDKELTQFQEMQSRAKAKGVRFQIFQFNIFLISKNTKLADLKK